MMFLAYAVLVAIGAFNRETSVLLVLCYMAFFPLQWRRWGVLLMVWATITAGLHLWLGAAPHQLGVVNTFLYNKNTISNAFFVNLLMLPLWVAVIFAYKQSSAQLKRLCWVAILYGVSILILAAWEEARLQMIIWPLILPIVLYGAPHKALKCG